MSVIHVYSLIVIIFASGCGNPAIIRYLSPADKSKPIGSDILPNGSNVKFKIYDEKGIRIYFKNATYTDIEQLLKKDFLDNVSFRIPALTYLIFYLENNSANDFSINLYDTQIVDEESNVSPVYQHRDFNNDYTSVAYKNFNYEKIFALYIDQSINQNQGKTSKQRLFFDKYSPGKPGTIKAGFRGIQIIPYKKITERHRQYIIYLPLPDFNTTITVPLQYVIHRADRSLK